MTPYANVFKSFKKRIEDKDLYKFSEEDQIEMLTGWLDTAISYIELERLRINNDLSDRDNETQMFNIDLDNCEVEVIAMYMVAAWYEPKINSLEHTLLFIGSKDEKWTAQKDHLDMMVKIQEKWKTDARKYFNKYGYKVNSYLGDE